MKVSKILLLISAFGISSCTHTVYKDRPVEILVPVYTPPPNPVVIDQPDLEIFKLTEGSSQEEISRAYYQTVIELKSYSDSLKESIRPFEKIEDENTN